MFCTPPPRRSNFTQNLNKSTNSRSLSPTPCRKSGDTTCYEIPMDPKSSFNISYLPGLNGYDIQTGSTLEEARLKVVTLTCEVERLNTYNYTLVRENEILKSQNDKTTRERDLEMKLAIVLAENEKLNEIIEELYEAFTAQCNSVAGQDEYELKIGTLMRELEDSKSKNILLEQNNKVELQNTINELRMRIQLLTDQLTVKDTDLELLRKRMASLELLLRENERLNQLLNESLIKIENLKQENNQLLIQVQTQQINASTLNELEILRSSSIAAQNRIQELQKENDNLRQQLALANHENNQLSVSLQTIQLNLHKASEAEQVKKSAHMAAQNRLIDLQQDNDNLRIQLESLKVQLAKSLDESRISITLVQDKERDYNATIVKLSNNINTLLAENEKLNAIAAENHHVVSLQAAIEDENRRLRAALEQADRHAIELDVKLREALVAAHKTEEMNFKMTLIINENEKLNSILLSKVEEIDALRLRLQTAEIRLVDFDTLIEKLQLISLDNERLQGQVSNQEIRYRDLQAEKTRIESELGSLNILFVSLRNESEEWQRKYITLEADKSHEEELQILRKDFEDIRQWAVRAREEQQKFSAERMAYETQLLQMEQHIHDLEAHCTLLEEQKDKLSNLNDERLRVIEQLKQENNGESLKLEVYELQSQLDNVKSVAYDVKQMLVQAQSEKESAERKVNDLLQQNNGLVADLTQLKQLIELRKGDSQTLSKQNEELRRLCDSLSKEKKSGSNRDVNDVIESYMLKISELENSRNEFKRQAERNATELTRKNRELVEKIQELDLAKLKYEEALANYQALNNKMFNRMSESRY